MYTYIYIYIIYIIYSFKRKLQVAFILHVPLQTAFPEGNCSTIR